MVYIVGMDIDRLKSAKGKSFKRKLNGKVTTYVDPSIVRSSGEIASHAISQALSLGKELKVDLSTINASVAPKEIGAGRGRKAAEISFSDDFDLDELVLNDTFRVFAQNNTIRLTLNADSMGLFVDGSVKNPTKAAARHIVKYVRSELGYNVSVRPDANGVKYLDIKIRDEWTEDSDTDTDEESDES